MSQRLLFTTLARLGGSTYFCPYCNFIRPLMLVYVVLPERRVGGCYSCTCCTRSHSSLLVLRHVIITSCEQQTTIFTPKHYENTVVLTCSSACARLNDFHFTSIEAPAQLAGFSACCFDLTVLPALRVQPELKTWLPLF